MATVRVDELEAALLAKFRRSQLALYEIVQDRELLNDEYPKLLEALKEVKSDLASLLHFRNSIAEAALCLERNMDPPEEGASERSQDG